MAGMKYCMKWCWKGPHKASGLAWDQPSESIPGMCFSDLAGELVHQDSLLELEPQRLLVVSLLRDCMKVIHSSLHL